MKNAIIYILLIVSASLSICVWANSVKEDARSPVEVVIEKRVPMSIRELQRFLCEAGHSRYKCEIDGKWGNETAIALDNYICDRYYKESLK